jgi:hypothetical protein
MATSIFIFNACPVGISLVIRNGKAVPISGTGGVLQWQPNFPTTEPAWGGTSPAPGQLGFGPNQVLIGNAQSLNSVTLTVNVPKNILPTSSLQIYFYYYPPSNDNPNVQAYWVGLNDGLPFGGVIPPALALTD